MARNRAKTIAAVVGAGAMVTLGTAGALTDGGGPVGPSVESASQMTLGSTATMAYSATEETSVAVPVDKAPPYGGSGG
ncbi:hypothetical protein [Mycobacterium sp. 1274761.0]|uniref:hypothetical protein n=1 Tax=Mycobacterium sp. 1274761.0 TaxID=1834077 RepID=UPI000802439B|nr:hypothetical protein [Mycobacterium sp. 1274761.0]OBK73299.1 hypothetical protein A5651_14245 [Mycobacterium sp. 1274761.0]